MAAPEVELERMVVRIVGDNVPLSKAYQQSIGQTKEFGKQVQQTGESVGRGFVPTEGAVSRLGMSLREMRKGMMLASATGMIGPEISHSLFMAAEGGKIATETIGRLTVSMGALKSVMVASGIGAVVAALGTAAAVFYKITEEATKAREAAKGAFDAFASGAQRSDQALSGMRTSMLREGLKDVFDTIANSDGAWQNLQNRVGSIAMSFAKLLSGQQGFMATLQQIKNSELSPVAAAAGNAERQFTLMAARIMAAKDAYDRFRSSVAAQPFIRWIENERLISSIQGVKEQFLDLQDQAARAGLSDVNQQIVSIAQSTLRANPILGDLTNTFRVLGPNLLGIRNNLNQIALSGFLRDIRMQGATMGMSSERAKLFEMSLNGVSDANIMAAESEVKHLEALQALKAGLEDVSGTRFGSTDALAKIAQYNNQFALAAQGSAIRQRLIEAGQSGLSAPAGSAVLAGSTAAGGAMAQQAQQVAVLGRIEALLTEMRNNTRPGAGNLPGLALQPAGVP